MKLEIKNFDDLDFDKQCELIKQASMNDKGDLILRSQNPESIISNFTAEDFFLVYQSSGTDLHPELLKMANINQKIFTSDFECWERDEVNKDNFLKWLEKLSLSDTAVLHEWLKSADFELLISGFLHFTEVLKTEHLELIDDYIGDRPFFTLDHLYYICIEGDNFEVLRQCIEILFEQNRPMYTQLVEALICINGMEIMEEAYQMRMERQAEYGFPSKDEAMKIFLNIRDWFSLEEKDDALEAKQAVNWTKMTLPVLRTERPLFLDRILALYFQEKPSDDSIYVEFVNLANKIIVCEELDFRNAETIFKALDRARKVVSLALEDLSQGKMDVALDFMGRYFIEDLHRWGITRLRKLKDFCMKIFVESKFSDLRKFCKFTGSPWSLKFKGIFRFYPVKAKEHADFDVIEYEDFESLSQVGALYEEFQEIRSIFHFFLGHFGADWSTIMDQDFDEVSLEGENVNMMSLLATLCAHLSLFGNISFEPITSEQVLEFLNNSFDNASPLRKLKKEVKESLIKALGMEDEGPVIKELTHRLEEELGAIDLRFPLDTHFIPILLTKKEKQDLEF